MEPLAPPSLPVPISLAACGAGLALVLLQIWRFRDVVTAFLFLSIWMRYSIGAFHEITYPPLALGLSVAAMSSVFVVAMGLPIVGVRLLALRYFTPVYALMLVILISASANNQWIGAFNELVKWLYLIVLTLAALIALRRHGSDRFFGALTAVFIAPMASQWISVALDLHLTNQDATVCFIGGYNHEQTFSIILLTFLFTTCFRQRMSATSTYLRLGVVAAGLALANYRTSVLAAALPAIALGVETAMARVVKKQRPVALVLVAATAVFVLVGVVELAHDRFSDLGTAVYKGASLIQPPQYFTMDERRLFSGRAYLWSEYIDAYAQGTIVQTLIGFGPDAWVGLFPLYAHNTFVSYLYELGLFGTAAFIWFIVANLLLAVQVSSDRRLVLAACHAGFIVLNLATMPMWTIEGDILYALLLAQTWYLWPLRSGADRAAAVRLAPASLAHHLPESMGARKAAVR